MKAAIAAAWLVGSGLLTCSPRTKPVAQSIEQFDRRLESLRQQSQIPAISVAIAKNQRITWSKGYGTADIATNRMASDTTVYHFASLTKPFASAILLQLSEEGRISLDDPLANYGIVLPSPPNPGVIRIRHLLSHTSSGMPGTRYSYDGNRFSLLDSVIARATGGSFGTELVRRILQPLALTRIAPNPGAAAFSATGLDRSTYRAKFARGYTYTNGTHEPTAYPTHFSTAAGLTGSVLDLAKFSMALDRGAVISQVARDAAFAPTISVAGDTLPYGLGWFSPRYKGERIVWHYGLWTAISSLIIKVPSRGLTFVVLANTDALSSPYPLAAGKLESSPWARAFLDAFVFGAAQLP
ncbi:MAG: serine hydrolase domain-containing protein [Gemmatimonadota bacterium]